MDRGLLAQWWDEARDSGLWAAPWSKLVEHLSAQQAAWKPAAARHSIWQIVEHVAFWRGVAVARTVGGEGPGEAEIARRNFPDPAQVSDAEWNASAQRFRESHSLVAAALADPSVDTSRLRYLIPHDAYHVGQIAYLRALQGLPSVE